MTELRFATEIDGSVEKIFDTIVDLRGYHRWLARSSAYPGTTEISSDPIAAGTTYVESSSTGVRDGTVTEFEPPTRVTFHQPMTMKPKFFGVIDIHVTYTLTPGAESVQVDRVVTLTFGWPLRLLRSLVLPQFRKESERTMLALKTFTEAAS